MEIITEWWPQLKGVSCSKDDYWLLSISNFPCSSQIIFPPPKMSMNCLFPILEEIKRFSLFAGQFGFLWVSSNPHVCSTRANCKIQLSLPLASKWGKRNTQNHGIHVFRICENPLQPLFVLLFAPSPGGSTICTCIFWMGVGGTGKLLVLVRAAGWIFWRPCIGSGSLLVCHKVSPLDLRKPPSKAAWFQNSHFPPPSISDLTLDQFPHLDGLVGEFGAGDGGQLHMCQGRSTPYNWGWSSHL